MMLNRKNSVIELNKKSSPEEEAGPSNNGEGLLLFPEYLHESFFVPGCTRHYQFALGG